MDPITCTLMRIPVILPSGNVIDSLTLDRHMANSLTDPYTGVKLDSDRDVVMHVGLKERIDKFCTLNPRVIATEVASNSNVGEYRLGRQILSSH